MVCPDVTIGSMSGRSRENAQAIEDRLIQKRVATARKIAEMTCREGFFMVGRSIVQRPLFVKSPNDALQVVESYGLSEMLLSA